MQHVLLKKSDFHDPLVSVGEVALFNIFKEAVVAMGYTIDTVNPNVALQLVLDDNMYTVFLGLFSQNGPPPTQAQVFPTAVPIPGDPPDPSNFSWSATTATAFDSMATRRRKKKPDNVMVKSLEEHIQSLKERTGVSGSRSFFEGTQSVLRDARSLQFKTAQDVEYFRGMLEAARFLCQNYEDTGVHNPAPNVEVQTSLDDDF